MTDKKGKRHLSDNAQLMNEWNWERNADIKPMEITLGSHKKVWWICRNGHEWQAKISDRVRGNGCPFCAGKRVIKGLSDLQTVNPRIALEWSYEKNSELTPSDIFPNSNKKVWWKCSQGHEWQATIASRNNGCDCPYCSGQKILSGYNDLQTINPQLAHEWNQDKNELSPKEISPNSSKRVWWICAKGHEWQASIMSRNNGTGCPYCASQKVLIGYNDLQTLNPFLANEWVYEKNNGITPMDVMPNSSMKVWWKCSKGHEWQASISNRHRGSGCPICNSERNTSFPEFVLVYYIKNSGLDVIHSYKGNGYELDVYIPSKKIAVEYDGCYWHRNKTEKDLAKNAKCKKDGITLYRIRAGLDSLHDSSIDYTIEENSKAFVDVTKKILFRIVGVDIDIDLERDSIAIESLREYHEKECSLLASNPEIEKEWNYEKNGNLKPENISANSSKKVWWNCSCGHEWQATVFSRNRGNGCPYCSGRKVLKGYNDLASINSEIITEWNYERNGDLKPENLTANSGKRVWWKCSNGHEWQTEIANRNRGHRCPYCSGKYVVAGENDLQSINVTLANEWNYEKNNDLTPRDVLPNSNKKVWWKCSSGHEWQATIANRNYGRGCPECAKIVIQQAKYKTELSRRGSLLRNHPELASEWDYARNGSTPDEVLSNTSTKVWWICSKGHHYETSPNSRTQGRNCPYCANKKVLSGYNDLNTLSPQIAKDWYYEKNTQMTPEMVTISSGKRVWWRCTEGHECFSRVADRTRSGGCPICSRKNRVNPLK